METTLYDLDGRKIGEMELSPRPRWGHIVELNGQLYRIIVCSWTHDRPINFGEATLQPV